MNFIPLTSLPRTGSTLLLYILDQNPIFEIGPDSEIGRILYHNKEYIQREINHFQLPHEKVTECFKNFCVQGTKAWIEQITRPEKIFIDKSRHWLKDLDYIFNLFPNAKIPITIRDLRGIANSYEKIHNHSLYIDREFFHEDLNYDIQAFRVNKCLNVSYIKDGLFSIKELLQIPKKFKNQIKFVRYEDLIKNPKQELDNIYDFLEMPQFDHDFNNIKQGFFHDNPYLPHGIHKIKNKIEYKKETFSEIRQDIQHAIVNEYRWYYEEFYPEIL